MTTIALPSADPGSSEVTRYGSGQRPVIQLLVTMTAPSGAPMAALRLADGLHGRGYDVQATFLYHRTDLNAPDFAHEELLAHPPGGLSGHRELIRRFWRALGRRRPDVLLAFLPLAGILGCMIARVRGTPVRLISHRSPRGTYGRAMRWLDLIAAWTGCYTGVIAVSRSVADSCAAYPGWLRRRTRVVYNGLRDWRPSPLDKQAARQRFGLPNDAHLLVAIGRLDHQKNYRLLLDALAGVRAPVMLAIAGEGTLRLALETQIEELGIGRRVRLLGNIARDDVPHLLAAADVFVQPSLFEGQSNALLEALHAGLPCLVSEIPEQIETVRAADGEVAGMILPLGDPVRWAEGIDRAATDTAWAGGAADTALRQAQLFTYDRMVDGFEMASAAQ